METLIQGVIGMGQEPGRIVMMLIGGLLMYLGIKKEYEPTLLVPMGLGTQFRRIERWRRARSV